MSKSLVPQEAGKSIRKGLESCPQFDAVFTNDWVLSIEAKHEESWGEHRRLTMLTLAQSSQHLIESFGPIMQEDGGDALIELIDRIGAYRDYLNAILSLADSALARLLMVGEYLGQNSDTDAKETRHE